MLDLDDENFKKCSECKKSKPLSSFRKRKGPKWSRWLRSQCRECESQYKSRYFLANKFRLTSRHTAWKKENTEKAKEYRQRWWEKNKDAIRAKDRAIRRRKLYGLSEQKYQEMLSSSGGLCAICKKPYGRPNIDHDHETGLVRDILCRSCNSGLGNFNDNVDVMRMAIAYLQRHGKAVVKQ